MCAQEDHKRRAPETSVDTQQLPPSDVSQLPTPTTPPSALPPVTGLSAGEAKACRQLLSSMQRHHAAWPFLQPVDPVAAGAPDYFNVVKHPMDLSTIERKLLGKEYPTLSGFASDIYLMINNCKTYNPAAHHVHQLAISLENYTSLQLNKMFPTLQTSIPTGETPDAGDRRTRRDVKPPRVFEPEEIPVKKSKSGLHREDDTGRPKNLKKRKSMAHSDAVADQISSLIGNLGQIQAQLADLRRKPVVSRSPSPAPPPKKRRKSKVQERQPSPSPATAMEVDDESITSGDIPAAAAAAGPDKSCEYCGTRATPMWRRGPSGKGTLCNKCGVKWRSGKIMGGDGAGPVLPVFETIRKSKKKAAAPAQPRPITDSQKAWLFEQINNGTIPDHYLPALIDVIRAGMPELPAGDEIELDVDKINPVTLAELYDLVLKACGMGQSVVEFAGQRRTSVKEKKPRGRAAAKKTGPAHAPVAASTSVAVAAEGMAPTSLAGAGGDDSSSGSSSGSDSDEE